MSRPPLRRADAQSFLAEASALLAASRGFEEVLQTTACLALAAGADFCLVDLVEPEQRVRRRAAAHTDRLDEARYAPVQRSDPPDSEQGPLATVLRSGRPLLVAAVTERWITELARTAEHRRALRELGVCSAMHLPLLAQDQGLGVLTLVSTDPDRCYDADDLLLAEELAGRAARALAEAREERRSGHLDDAEAAQERFSLLVEASSVLASSLNLEAALDRLARLLTPAFAEVCLIHLVEEDDTVRVAAGAAADPGWALPRREGQRLLDDPSSPPGLSAVLRAAEPQLHLEVPNELLPRVAGCPELPCALNHAGSRSCILVPLRVPGAPTAPPLGAITLIGAPAGAPYGESDLRLAEELAHRVAAAVYGSHLLRGVEEALKARRQAAEGLRAIAARARCLLWFADVEDRGGHALRWQLRLADDEAARRFLPVTVPPGHTYGMALTEARLPEDRERMAWGDDEVRAGRSYHQEFRVRNAAGEIRWLAEDVQIEPSGPSQWEAVGVCVDITERKRLEEALRAQAAALAEADRRKDAFLAMLAHELRNPLGAMVNSLQVLQHSHASEEARQRALGVLSRQIHHQERMVNDLLDVSRIARGLVDIRAAPLDLTALLRETVEDHRATFHEAGVELNLQVPDDAVFVEGDRIRLAQVFGNLLSNARKFSERGGSVEIALDRGDEEVAVRIRDDGIGISDQLLPHIFDSFVQGDSSLARSSGGLGLGLSLVRGLVQLHDGSVTAQSDGPGRGAEFLVRLPLAQAAGLTSSAPAHPRTRTSTQLPNTQHPAPNTSADPTPTPPHTHTSTHRKVLVVEDNRDAAETLRDLIELKGCAVELAHTGAAGLDAARRTCPDVVLCDIGLPDVDGYAVAAALRGAPDTRGTRLIAISGYGRDEDRRRALDAGFDHYLVKPFAPEALYRLVLEEGPQLPAVNGVHEAST